MKYPTMALLSSMIAIGSMQAFYQEPQEPLSALEETEKALYQIERDKNYLGLLPRELKEETIKFRASSTEKAIQKEIIKTVRNRDLPQFKKLVSLINPNKPLVAVDRIPEQGIPEVKFRNLLHYLTSITSLTVLSNQNAQVFKKMAEFLFKKGIDVNAKDENGATVLINLIRDNIAFDGYEGTYQAFFVNFLQFLLEHGANPNITDRYETSALDEIQDSVSLKHLSDWLKSYGALTGKEIRERRAIELRKALYEEPFGTYLDRLPIELSEEIIEYGKRNQ